MEVLATRPENPFHARSISLPTRSHPISASAEEEIEKLRQLEAGPNQNADIICAGLFSLSKLHEYVKELLELPLTQQALDHHREKKWLEEVMDYSVRFVDLCGITRDILQQMKESLRNLQSAIRTRRVGETAIECNIGAYICSRKKVKKQVKKCTASLKLMGNNFEVCSHMYEDQHLQMLVKVLGGMREVTIIIFKSFLHWMAATKEKAKASKWSLVSRMVHKGAVTCEAELEITEVESADHAVSCLSRCKGSQDAQMKLKNMELCIDSLERGLEYLFRRSIQTRASLLNSFIH